MAVIKKRTIGRGLDFEQRFNSSRWAEDILFRELSMLNLVVVRLGASKVAKVIERGADELEVKEPDLLVLKRELIEPHRLDELESTKFDVSEIPPDVLRRDPQWLWLWDVATIGIEVEFSPYRAAEMAKRHWARRLPDSTRRVPKHANPPMAPNIWVKVEDLPRLKTWEALFSVPIYIIHVFDQEAFGIKLSTILDAQAALGVLGDEAARKRQLTTGIFLKEQNYNRQDQEAASEKKQVFVVSPAAAIKVANVVDVKVESVLGTSSGGKYVAHVLFKGGTLNFTPEFWEELGIKLPI